MKKLKWLVLTNLGRYALGAMLLFSGIFSQYGTIPFLTTDWVLFEYSALSGAILMLGQFIVHISVPLYYFIKSKIWKS